MFWGDRVLRQGLGGSVFRDRVLVRFCEVRFERVCFGSRFRRIRFGEMHFGLKVRWVRFGGIAF